MRVLLVRPPSVLGRMSRQNLQHPTNILGLASELNARGHEATILDLEVAPPPPGMSSTDVLLAEIDASDVEVVGVSVVTPHVPAARLLLGAARRHRPSLLLLAGGPHATALPGDLLSEIPALDAVCLGEGDEALPELLDAVAAGRSPTDVVGWMFAEEGSTGAREPLADLDVLAPPDRRLLDWAAYIRLGGFKGVASPGIVRSGIHAAQVHLSRGCYARCVFCSTNSVWGERARPGIRRRSLEHVLTEIDELIDTWHVNHLNFEDDIFPPTLAYLDRLCQALAVRPVTWSCNARVDGLRREHFEAMAASGCLKIDFGVESGSDRILELNQKLVTRDRVESVFEDSRRAGILRTAYLMLGSHIDERPEEVEQTWNLARAIEPDYITFTLACPYPGTQLWKDCREHGYLELRSGGRPDWKRYGYYPGLPPWRFHHFTPSEMVAVQKRFLRRFYWSPGFAWRMLRRVRSPEQLRALLEAGRDVTGFIGGRHVGAEG